MKGSISAIETSGFVDGPGIRTVVFLNGCKLRCKYCHNPEMWEKKDCNYTVDELVEKVMRNKEYFGKRGGVTFSGGEPLLQAEFLIAVCKKLKKNNIHIALDTAGVGNGNYKELLKYVDLILLDVKDTTKEGFKELTGFKFDESLKFIEECNKMCKKIWIRQVIVPERNDTIEYLKNLKDFLKRIKNIERIDFLPYHNMAVAKYEKLGLDYPFKGKAAMDKLKCEKLYKEFIKLKGKKEK